MIRLVISKTADLEIEEIGDYIARQNRARSVTFVTDLRDAIQRIPRFPAAYPSREEWGPGLRMALRGRYVIVFRETATEVRILHVTHGARDLARLLRGW
ncbi:MAG: type II toxin-antitoxin system RelE/ParE family toxin [Rhizomicrobium sp.]